MVKTEQRKKYLIDAQLQVLLARRIILFWVAGGVAVFAFPVAVTFVFGMIGNIPVSQVLGSTFKTLWFPALSAVLVIPWVIWYSVRLSHRIAGPMFRFKNEVDNRLNGQVTRPLVLRKNDFFQDFAQALDRLIDSHRQLEERLSEARRRNEQLQSGRTRVEMEV